MYKKLTFNDISCLRNEMLKIAKMFGATYDSSQDIVQDVMIKIWERGVDAGWEYMSYNGEPNLFFIFTLVKNKTVDYYRKSKKTVSISEANIRSLVYACADEEKEEEATRAHSSFCSLHGNIHWFDYQIAYLYYYEFQSLRKMQKATGISIYFITKILKDVESEVKETYTSKAKLPIYREAPSYTSPGARGYSREDYGSYRNQEAS